MGSRPFWCTVLGVVSCVHFGRKAFRLANVFLRAKFCLASMLFLVALTAFAQSNYGELQLRVTDPAGLAVKTTVQIVSAANQYRTVQSTSDAGFLRLPRLPYGIYRVEINEPGFAPVSEVIEIHSSLPTSLTIQLKLPAVNQSIGVNATNTLIDPEQPRFVSELGTDLIQYRAS